MHLQRKQLTKQSLGAMDKFNYSEDKESNFMKTTIHFRTMHSLAFQKTWSKQETRSCNERRHYEDLGRKLNLFIDYNEYDEEETGLFTTKSDYLRIINLAKLRNITLDQQVKLGDHTTEIDYDTLVHLSNELTRYKQENNLIDYNDMILEFIKSDKSPKFDVVFIDEAQDLVDDAMEHG